ncbi:hypothetical protein KY329_05695 [Candidatus Woesearchaeota archaeon]|nr:hypothetical protein [Candidatus Woesearchaeota archaeon]
MDLIKITPNKEKAKSILKMVDTTLSMISTINLKYSSNIIKEYYEVIRELITTILLLDGYKTYGDGAHKTAIDYIAKYLTTEEILFIHHLRILRNRIAYEGFFVTEDFLKRKKKFICKIVNKLRKTVNDKLSFI